jgi:hypothetical protein
MADVPINISFMLSALQVPILESWLLSISHLTTTLKLPSPPLIFLFLPFPQLLFPI